VVLSRENAIPVAASERIGAVLVRQNRPGQCTWTSIMLMSARPEERGGSHDVIRLGGETAVVVPLQEYRMLAALRERASADEIEEAELAPPSPSTRRGRPLAGPAAPFPMRRPWLNCSAAAGDDRLAARRAGICAPVHG
jgi:hypothetical protein